MYNGVITEYAPVDALNRSPWMRHMFNGTELARFDYGFDDLNRMKYEQRNGATADGYAYDPASEVTGFNRDGTLSNGVVTGGNIVSTLGYDFAGNRSQVTSNGAATAWSVNNLNEYTAVGAGGVGSDSKGNISSYNGWTYTYDAQNRLRVASGNGKTLEFWYDGRNRQICRRINGNDYQITRTVWDGWNVLEERDVNDAFRQYYLYGARTDELVLRWGVYGDHWYGYDGRGNVSHLFAYSYNGLIIESYTYNLEGAPTFSGPNNESLVENRFLFQGRDYLKEGGIYDYRNRFYHPGLGRFLQPDPIGFKGDAGNLYRYCGNDPVDRTDPMGLYVVRVIDFDPGIPASFANSSGSTDPGTGGTTGVPIVRKLANATIIFAPQTLTRSSGNEKAIDRETQDRAVMEAHRIAKPLFGASQNDHPPGWEWSREVVQNNANPRIVKSLSETRGHDQREGGTNKHGSDIHTEQVPAGYHLVAHVYTQKTEGVGVRSWDLWKFDRTQIMGIAISPCPTCREGYSVGYYNPPKN